MILEVVENSSAVQVRGFPVSHNPWDLIALVPFGSGKYTAQDHYTDKARYTYSGGTTCSTTSTQVIDTVVVRSDRLLDGLYECAFFKYSASGKQINTPRDPKNGVLIHHGRLSIPWQAGIRELRLEADKRLLNAKYEFLQSFCNSYPDLVYEVIGVREIEPLQSLENEHQRWLASLPQDCTVRERSCRSVFHTCRHESVELIERNGLRPSKCLMCRGEEAFREHDCGWFGDHTKGVYVSKHADYTFFYQNNRDPIAGDDGEVILLHAETGKVRHFTAAEHGVAPTAGVHCHESPNHMEFFLWDDATRQNPPQASCRALPKFVIRWHAVRNERLQIAHDQ